MSQTPQFCLKRCEVVLPHLRGDLFPCGSQEVTSTWNFNQGMSFNQLHVVYPWLTDDYNYTLKCQVEQPFMVQNVTFFAGRNPACVSGEVLCF